MAGQVVIGRLAGAESIPVRMDLRSSRDSHSAVLGSTGSESLHRNQPSEVDCR